MEHLFLNCHGELNALFAILASLPFVGAWVRSKFGGKNENDHDRKLAHKRSKAMDCQCEPDNTP